MVFESLVQSFQAQSDVVQALVWVLGSILLARGVWVFLDEDRSR